MADKKISALTSASTPLVGTEVLPIVQSGATVKVAASSLTAGSWQQAFSAYLSANQATTINASTKILIDTEEFDIGGGFNTGTSRFLPTVAGYYQVTANVLYQTGAAGVINPSIYKNGVAAKVGNTTPVNAVNVSANVSALIYLNGTTDYIEFYSFQSGGVGFLAIAGAANTYFQAVYVRG
jgi:hypothetical protein